MSTKLECEICHKNFNTLSSLNHHIKTAKYCLKIQNGEEINVGIKMEI